MTSSRKSKFGYLVAGIVIGAISFAMAPAIGHVGDKVGHLWNDHLFDKAKADFFTKSQSNQRFFTKSQSNQRFFTKTQSDQRFVNIDEAADVAHDIDCTGCIESDQLVPEGDWTEAQFSHARWGNTDNPNTATVGYMKDRFGVVHLKGTVELFSDPTQAGTLIFTLPGGFGSSEGTRVFLVPKSIGVGMSTVAINSGGQVIIYPNSGQVGDMYSFDGISYRP